LLPLSSVTTTGPEHQPEMIDDEQFIFLLKEASVLAIACSILICAACLFL
jgi:hypothetical protein